MLCRKPPIVINTPSDLEIFQSLRVPGFVIYFKTLSTGIFHI